MNERIPIFCSICKTPNNLGKLSDYQTIYLCETCWNLKNTDNAKICTEVRTYYGKTNCIKEECCTCISKNRHMFDRLIKLEGLT